MAVSSAGISDLEYKARELRKLIIQMVTEGGLGHVGPALSCADIITCLYGDIMNIDPSNPRADDRDRFILSAGHKCAALYCILALQGFFPMDTLKTYLQEDSLLGGHPVLGLPGVEFPTGSLGHGLSIGAGMALAARLCNKNHKVYVLLGDGELAEGTVWEDPMHAGHNNLTNLVAIIDRNTLQCDGRTEDVMSLEPLASKWESFGWGVRTVNGHDMNELRSALSMVPVVGGKPTVVIARTRKGRGVSFIEDRREWHYRAPSQEEAIRALKELEAR